MKSKISILVLTASLLALGGCSSTPRDPSVPTGRIVGEVIQVVKAPDRCEENDKSGQRALAGLALGLIAGNQVGGGSGKKWAQGVLGLGGAIAGKNSNKENDDLMVCKDRGWLMTIAYRDNFGKFKSTEKRWKQPRQVGELVEFKL